MQQVRTRRATLWAILVLILAVPASHAELIVIRSGNGLVGAPDSQVNKLIGPDSTEFAPLTPADFTAARTGSDAFVITPNPAWIPSLPSDPSAQWVGTVPFAGLVSGNTALYAIDFNLTAPFTSATLELNYSVDNQLGGSQNQGVFLNGTAISGASTGGNFSTDFTISRSDIAPLLMLGQNTLYINATNLGGPAGVIFSATIETSGSPTAVPEPTSFALLATAASGVGYFGWRRRKQTTVV